MYERMYVHIDAYICGYNQFKLVLEPASLKSIIILFISLVSGIKRCLFLRDNFENIFKSSLKYLKYGTFCLKSSKFEVELLSMIENFVCIWNYMHVLYFIYVSIYIYVHLNT